MLGGGSNQNNNLMMYAVVLQNAAEEARFVDHERRMRNQLNQNENEEEDESVHENENASHIEEVAVEEGQESRRPRGFPMGLGASSKFSKVR